MRANSATVPKTCAGVSTVDAKASTWIKQVILNGPQCPKMVPKLVPKWTKWSPNGYRIAKMGPKCPTRGPQRDQGHQMMEKGPPQGGPRRENAASLGDKKRSKSIKKRVWKQAGFQVALGIDFWVHFAQKWYPKGSNLRPKSIRNLHHVKKTSFRCHTVNTMVF